MVRQKTWQDFRPPGLGLTPMLNQDLLDTWAKSIQIQGNRNEAQLA